MSKQRQPEPDPEKDAAVVGLVARPDSNSLLPPPTTATGTGPKISTLTQTQNDGQSHVQQTPTHHAPHGTHITSPEVTAQNLKLFREEIGISPLPDDPKNKRNTGVYNLVIREEWKTNWKYLCASSILNAALLIQLAIGAILTALGASKAPHIAIAVLGAVNTVFAGVLTYLKGQGLPYRLLIYRNELRKVKAAIDRKERDFACGRAGSDGIGKDVFEEADKLARKLKAVIKDSENNYPEAYLSGTDMGAGGSLGGGVTQGEVGPKLSIHSAPPGLRAFSPFRGRSESVTRKDGSLDVTGAGLGHRGQGQA